MVYDRSKVFTSHVNNFFSPSWLVLATHACSTMTVHSLNPYTSWNYLLLQGTMCVFVCVWGVRGLQSPAFGSSSINKSLREELPSTCLPFVLMEWGNRKEKHKNTAAIWPFFLKYWKVVCCCAWSSVNFGCGTRRRRTGWLFPCNFLSYFYHFPFPLYSTCSPSPITSFPFHSICLSPYSPLSLSGTEPFKPWDKHLTKSFAV